MNDQQALAIALEEARISYEEGGVPVRIPPSPHPAFLPVSAGGIINAPGS